MVSKNTFADPVGEFSMALREAILGLLSDGPMTGYEIKQFFKNVIKHFWNVSDGQLYPTLKQMHESGLISRKVIRQDSTANKHVYSLTEDGRTHFEGWLKEPVTKFEELKEPLVIKVFFFDKLPREEILTHLRYQLDLHNKILEEFRNIRKPTRIGLRHSSGLIGDVGLLYVEVRILWLARMIELVEQDRVTKKHALYTEEMVDIGKKFLEEIFSDMPSQEFQSWMKKVLTDIEKGKAQRSLAKRVRCKARQPGEA